MDVFIILLKQYDDTKIISVYSTESLCKEFLLKVYGIPIYETEECGIYLYESGTYYHNDIEYKTSIVLNGDIIIKKYKVSNSI